jgi:hypothetical protein
MAFEMMDGWIYGARMDGWVGGVLIGIYASGMHVFLGTSTERTGQAIISQP